MKMPEIGPLLEQGMTAVYQDSDQEESSTTTTRSDTMTVNSLVTGNIVTQDTSTIVTSTNIDTIISTTRLNIGDISITTLSPLAVTGVTDNVGVVTKNQEITTLTAVSNKVDDNLDDAFNLSKNRISDEETISNPIQSNFVTSTVRSQVIDLGGGGGENIKDGLENHNEIMPDESTQISSQQFDSDLGLATVTANSNDIQDKNEEGEAIMDDMGQKIDPSIPLISVNDLIPSLQDKVRLKILF